MSDVTETSAPDDDESERRPGVLAGVVASVRETGASLGSVFRNPNLRRVQLALGGSMIGDWAYATAVAVWAYGVGGAAAVGIWSASRMALIALTAPLGATLADRYPRRAVMIVADAVRATLVAVAALCLFLESHPAFVFVLATLTAVVSTAFRPAQRSLMPALANHPQELTASNGTASTLESLAFFIGPALGALVLVVADVQTVFLLNAATFAWSMMLLTRVRVPQLASPAPADGSATEARKGFLSAGFRTIAGDRDLLTVAGVAGAQTIATGASYVLTVVMAVEILDTGPEGVGYLESMIGVGAILGGFTAIARASRRKPGQDMTVGVVLWSAPLLLVTAWPSPVAAFVAVALLGFGNPLVDVNLETIVQRIAPDAVMGRVFGALEACMMGIMAIGAASTPFLLEWLGLRLAMGVLGLLVATLAVAGLRRMRSIDRRLGRPAGLDLVQEVPMFSPLAPGVVESLATRLIRVPVAAGDVVLREGEASDRFYIIESGLVEVTQQGAVLRRQGSGEFFGEIGLLQNVPRSATVTAVEHTELLAIERDDFLAAVTGHAAARIAAEDVVMRRLTV